MDHLARAIDAAGDLAHLGGRALDDLAALGGTLARFFSKRLRFVCAARDRADGYGHLLHRRRHRRGRVALARRTLRDLRGRDRDCLRSAQHVLGATADAGEHLLQARDQPIETLDHLPDFILALHIDAPGQIIVGRNAFHRIPGQFQRFHDGAEYAPERQDDHDCRNDENRDLRSDELQRISSVLLGLALCFVVFKRKQALHRLFLRLCGNRLLPVRDQEL